MYSRRVPLTDRCIIRRFQAKRNGGKRNQGRGKTRPLQSGRCPDVTLEEKHRFSEQVRGAARTLVHVYGVPSFYEGEAEGRGVPRYASPCFDRSFLLGRW